VRVFKRHRRAQFCGFRFFFRRFRHSGRRMSWRPFNLFGGILLGVLLLRVALGFVRAFRRLVQGEVSFCLYVGRSDLSASMGAYRLYTVGIFGIIVVTVAAIIA